MKRLWVTGYRSYELQIFSDQDPKYQVIDYAIQKLIIQAISDSGTEWVITGGQLGIEQMAAKAALTVKADYPELNVSILLPFAHFGNQWKEENQTKLASLLTQVDFTGTVSNQDYQSPQQLRNYQDFMLRHTDGALLIYDPEHEGKTQYEFDAIKKWQDSHDYDLRLVDFDELQEFSYDYQEFLNNSSNL
ncbi:DUF1273 domain-containing protein [Secundilactobacillus kimchicus]|uniref:UPF0398 protein FC96_GL000250 n=1 Tax=Secundilactobacillus kimchicus JCM 15530 TaxID=1302272 RepID=A0A0R1HR49_9LACO|nr:DUF1273 domain-containing protein [Secundilactobacillus kimchicus]KRK49326.1 hypothetical protein FC96_GL000250 [Secundilactobacillus kimchicus JCM 15530]